MSIHARRAVPCTSQIQHTVEHSPVYDLDAYQQRQRGNRRQQIYHNIASLLVFLIAISLPITMLFLESTRMGG